MKASLQARERISEAPVHGGAWPLAEPFAIGGVPIDNRVVQAPLAGIANAVFRSQSRRHGAGLAVSEMVSSHGLLHGNRRTRDLIEITDEPRPVAIQIFGAQADVMAEAARIVEDAGADLVDINMGCPVPKICKTGAGARMLEDPAAAAEVVAAMVRAVRIPVTVKMRSGLTPATARPVETAKAMEAAGAAAITFHPRAAAEEYRGRADHALTGDVARGVGVPVIASGDITSAAEAAEVVAATGCAAVAIGRGALGNPWLFGAVARGEPLAPPPLAVAVAEAEAFARAVADLIGPDRATGYMRKFYAWYLAGQDVPKRIVEGLQTAPALEEALASLAALAARSPVTA